MPAPPGYLSVVWPPFGLKGGSGAEPEMETEDGAVPAIGADAGPADAGPARAPADAGPADAGPARAPADAGPGAPAAPAAPAASCCTITTETIATSPANRARTKFGVGEPVKVTSAPGAKNWSVTGDGTVVPSFGTTTAVFIAGDTAGPVKVTATAGPCVCSVDFTVVAPASWTMERQPGTNVRHRKGRPDCGWKGLTWFHPDDVNFQMVQDREKDSTAVTSGAYNTPTFIGAKHGNYAGGFSGWFGLTRHQAAKGTTDDAPDTIYSGDPGPAATGATVPFKVGTLSFPITLQWRVGSKPEHDFPTVNQEHEIFSAGTCDSRKGGHTESTLFSDGTSGYT
jgi:hypothetical protein